MTTQLAIGYLAGPPRNPRGAAQSTPFATPAGRDSLAARPAIPQAVITWSDDEVALPVGAGDPAVAIEGPACFGAIRDRIRGARQPARLSLDAVLFSVLVVLLAGLAGAVSLGSTKDNTVSSAHEAVALEAAGRRASVDVGELRVEASPRAPQAVVAARAQRTSTVAN